MPAQRRSVSSLTPSSWAASPIRNTGMIPPPYGRPHSGAPPDWTGREPDGIGRPRRAPRDLYGVLPVHRRRGAHHQARPLRPGDHTLDVAMAEIFKFDWALSCRSSPILRATRPRAPGR